MRIVFGTEKPLNSEAYDIVYAPGREFGLYKLINVLMYCGDVHNVFCIADRVSPADI